MSFTFQTLQGNLSCQQDTYKRLNPLSLYCFTNLKCCKAIINSLFCLSPSSLLFPSFCVFLQHSFCVQPGAGFFFSFWEPSMKVTSSIVSAARGVFVQSPHRDGLAGSRLASSWKLAFTERSLKMVREHTETLTKTHRYSSLDHLISFWDGVWLSLLEALLT